MKNNIYKTQWQQAKEAGIIMSIPSIVYMIIKYIISSNYTNIEDIPNWINSVSIIIWAINIVVNIWLLKYLLVQRYLYEDINQKSMFKYGVKIVLFSSFIVAVATLANLQYFSKPFIDKQLQMYLNNIDGLTYNVKQSLELIQSKLPISITIFTFIECFIYGVFLSKIISKSSFVKQ